MTTLELYRCHFLPIMSIPISIIEALDTDYRADYLWNWFRQIVLSYKNEVGMKWGRSRLQETSIEAALMDDFLQKSKGKSSPPHYTLLKSPNVSMLSPLAMSILG